MSVLRAKRRGHFSVSWGVKFSGVALVGLALLVLGGCGAVENAGKAMGEQVGRDTFRPTDPTTKGVSVHLYIDRSKSMYDLRKEAGEQLISLMDIYPEAVTTTVHYYDQTVNKIKTVVSSGPVMQDVVAEFKKDPSGDPPTSPGTNLAMALRDLQNQAAREPEAQVVGVFVTDGGFEDDQGVVAQEAERLREIPNVPLLIFLGLDSRGTGKLTLLDEIVRDRFTVGSAGGKQFYQITLDGGEAMLSQARDALKEQVNVTKGPTTANPSTAAEDAP